MRSDMDKLRGKLAERRITQEELASRIGIDGSTFSRKMKSNGLSFTVGQMHKIASELSLSSMEAQTIFFGENSHNCEIERNNAS